MKQVLAAGQKGAMVDPWPPLSYKAIAKLNYFVDDKDGHISFNLQKKQQALTGASIEIENFSDRYEQQIIAIQKNYEDKFGEGKSNPFDAACADDTKAKNAFLSSSNSLLRDAFNDYLAFMRRKINNEIYYNQYTMWPENFELAKVQAKLSWLGLIHSQNPKFLDKSIWCQDNKDLEARPFKLANFDDIACNYKSSLNLGCVKMETNCGQTTTTYGCGDITFTERELGQNYIGGTLKIAAKEKIGISEGPLSLDGFIGGNVTIELDENNNVKEWKGKVTAGIEGGVGVHEGPVKAGASATEALEIEFGSTGVTDVVIVSAAKVEAGIEAPKSPGNKIADEKINEGIDYANKGLGHLNTKVELGVEGRTSLISGHGSVSGAGSLEGIKLSEW
jgi:hypothetical protein